MNQTINLALLELEQRLLKNDLDIWENLLQKCIDINNLRLYILIILIVCFGLLVISYIQGKKIKRLEYESGNLL